MRDKGKTKAQLIKEMAEMRLRIAELEKSESKHVETEKALRESEELYRVLIETSPDSIIMYSLSGELLAANAQVAKIYGVSSVDEFLQEVKKIFDLLTEEGKAFAAANLRRVFSEGYLQKNEYLVRNRNGTLLPMEINSSVIRTVTGEPRAFISVIRDITERKRAEGALRKSEEKYRLIAENMADVISVVDMNLRFTYVSPSIMRIRGFTVEEAMAQTLDQVMTPESLKITFAVFEEEMKLEASGTAAPNRIRTMEVEEYRKDGSIIWVEASLSYLRDKDRKPVAILSVTRDITKRRRAEETLRKSEEYFRAITENTSDIIFIVDALGTITYASPSLERFAGYSPDELIGTSGFDLISPDDLPRAIEDFGRALLTKEVVILNSFRIRHKDGTERIMEGIGMNLMDNPAVEGFVMNVRDVTDRKRAEEALRKSETMLKSVFDAVPVVVIVLDSDRIIRNVNDGTVEILGYPWNEMLGHNSRFLYFTDEEYNQAGEALYGNPSARGASAIEVRMRRKDGAEIWMLLGASPLQVEDALTGAVVAAIDITVRKSLEAQLRRAQKMEAIGALAGGIAHDFNNILSAIMGYTDMALREPEVNDLLRCYLNQVFKAGERARDLVKQILTFSRQTEGKLQPFRLSPIIKEVLKLLRASLPTSITIRQDIRSEPDTVLADPTQIHQIMMNLSTNAAHAMRETKGELKVSLVPVEIKPQDPLNIHHGLNPGMYLKLTVSDTGHGIESVIMGRIFDPFFTTKKPGEGTGMGLSVVHGIVKSCHGAITVESEVTKGTAFHVYLPLLNETGEEREVETVEHIIGGKEHILFVDDEAVLVQLGKDMLTGLGYEVIGSTHSLEALKLFRDRPDRFDLVITDMTMPYMTGIELAQEIMRIRPEIPVFLCTGFSEVITPEKAKALGLREFIMKPIIKNRIAEAIRRVLDQKEQG